MPCRALPCTQGPRVTAVFSQRDCEPHHLTFLHAPDDLVSLKKSKACTAPIHSTSLVVLCSHVTHVSSKRAERSYLLANRGILLLASFMAAYKEDYELSELEGRGGNGLPNPPIEDTDGLRSVENDDDDGESEKGDEFVESLRYTPEEERVVVKKLDRRLVLFVAFLYMLSFLDRSSKPATLTLREQ